MNQLVEVLQKHSSVYAWEYTDMRGIDPNTCIHHIFIEQSEIQLDSHNEE